MPVVFSHKTAMSLYCGNPRLASRARIDFDAAGRIPATQYREVADALGLKAPVDVLVAQREERSTYLSGISCHLAPSLLPKESLVFGDGFLLASPELCFLEMASRYDFVDLILLGYRMCGDYRPASERSKEGDLPLTSVAKLSEFLDGCSGCKGVKQARRALKYVRDGSNSRMESRLCLILILPPHEGGYGLPPAQLNQRIPGTNRKGDLCWLDKGFVIEYDSTENHGDCDASLNRDAIRRMQVGAQGVEILSVTRWMVKDDKLLDQVAGYSADRLGVRMRPRAKDCAAKRAALKRRLFHSAMVD